MYKNFGEHKSFKTDSVVDNIYGGALLAISSKNSITFYDWVNFEVIRRIELVSTLKQVHWSEDSSKVTLALEDKLYLLKYNALAVS